MKYKEVTLMELAAEVYNMGDDLETRPIDFANCDADEVEWQGGWCGIAKVHDRFDTYAPMYLIGHYGDEGSTLMYSISEYDLRIGKKVDELTDDYTLSPEATIECIAEMIIDYIELKFGEKVVDVLVMDVEEQ